MTSPRYCPLPDYGCIEVRGADATSFLQGQLSRSIESLAGTHAPLASWNDARGRLRALFRVVRHGDGWLLWTTRDVVATAATKLKMFVLRSKVTLATDGDWRAAALVDADASWLAAHGRPTATANVVARDGLIHVQLGTSVWLAFGSAAAIDAFEPTVARADADAAALAEIRLGIPTITTATADRYIPQMLNLERLDAISFDKGCYPGQEVIARVQHLGSVKRRMRRYSIDGATLPSAGTAILTGTGDAAGEVIRAARAGAGIEVLAVVDQSARTGPLLLGGTLLTEQPLPYAVPAE